MRVGSLFAGIGGFDLAASRVWGWDCVRWQVEIDPWARRVLAKHWPNVPKHGDIRELTGDELEPVDLVCGGFPCQPFSKAGAQRGTEDERYLWPEMARVVSLVKPRWVVGENVSGLINLGLDAVCTDLEGAGYEVWTLGIPACAVGAPHRRERLWLVAYSGHAQPSGRNEATSGSQGATRRELASCRCSVADANSAGLARLQEPVSAGRHRAEGHAGESGWWAVEPAVGRVAYGIPGRVDRLRGLGNAIVPAVAERLFRWIDEAEAGA